MKRVFSLLVFALLTAGASCAQGNLFARYEAHTSAIQAKQPAWPPPVVAPYPMLIQVFRADFTRQITPTGISTWNYGSSRGLNLVPGFNSEFDFYYPDYFQHNTPKVKDGFGDVGFLYKYRILSKNEKEGNYMLSAQLTATLPTGSHTNGSPDSSVSPSILGGKGFGRFDVIASLGGTLPTGETQKLGRSIAFNTTAQYHLGKYLWPELENSMTHYDGGTNNGKTQNFLTPGITVSKFKFRPSDPASRLGFACGAGMQLATSQFHTYNHNLVLTSRLIF